MKARLARALQAPLPVWLLPGLLALCIGRLWLMPLLSSFWVDEMVTAFVVHYGPNHPSFEVAPQVPQSIYYVLPMAAEKLFGFSEIVYRIPSALLMGVALYLIARLAARLIHSNAGWFAVFACLGLRGINYAAGDARPYALGICVAAASLLFLVRWLDSGRVSDALLFGVFAALLWRIHLIDWPFYLVLGAYAVIRLWRGEARPAWWAVAGVFALVGITLLPVALAALALKRQASAHVIAPVPTLRELRGSLKLLLVLIGGAGAWLLSLYFRWPIQRISSLALVAVGGWWLVHPASLYGFSWLTGNSVFIPRYLSLGLPGAALAATAAAGFFVPASTWKPLAAVFAVGVLLSFGDWKHMWPRHHNSDWRAAAAAIRGLNPMDTMPVVCPSPFIEARPPVWQPDYPLPGFLYSYLPVYPTGGKPYLFPFESSPEARGFAAELSRGVLPLSGRFVIYGGDRNVRLWRDWFRKQPELEGWSYRSLGEFGDVDAVLFEGRK